MTGNLPLKVPAPISQIDSPDQIAQYRNALSRIEGRLPTAASAKESTKSADLTSGGRLATGLPALPEWLFVSVWRQAILQTGDDRRSDGRSQIMSDLKVWDEWVQKKHRQIALSSRWEKRSPKQASRVIGMVSMPLIEGVNFELSLQSLEREAKTNNLPDTPIKLIPESFSELQQVVDAVSPDMAASHLLWVYHNGTPVFRAIHHAEEGGDALSLSSKVDELLDLPQAAVPDGIPDSLPVEERSKSEAPLLT